MSNDNINSLNCEDDKYCISYEKSLEYWADIPPTVDGVLGGFGFISDVDIDGSTRFLKSLFESNLSPACNIAVDCGAGIGRITKDLLTKYFAEVDVVEPDEKFISSVKEFVGKQNNSKVCNLYKVGLQEFIPVRKYDVMWNQWVLGYLTDTDLVLYLNRCSIGVSVDVRSSQVRVMSHACRATCKVGFGEITIYVDTPHYYEKFQQS